MRLMKNVAFDLRGMGLLLCVVMLVGEFVHGGFAKTVAREATQNVDSNISARIVHGVHGQAEHLEMLRISLLSVGFVVSTGEHALHGNVAKQIDDDILWVFEPSEVPSTTELLPGRLINHVPGMRECGTPIFAHFSQNTESLHCLPLNPEVHMCFS